MIYSLFPRKSDGMRSAFMCGLLALTLTLFVPLDGRATDLRAPSVRALLGNGIGKIMSDGLFLWVGTDAGVGRILLLAFDSGDWTTFTREDGLSGDGITAMAVGHGEVWTASARDSSVMQSEVGEGISVTRDRGQTWTTFRPERAFGLGNTVWGLAVTPGAVWAATWNAFGFFDTGLIRSRDRGESWEPVNPNTRPNGEFTFSVVADGPRVWVGTAGGVSRSADDGATWAVADTAQGLTGNWVFAMDVQVVNGDSVLWAGSWPAGPGQRYGVARSADGGATWSAIDTLMDIQAVDFAFVDSTAWVATLDGLWRSRDSGATWRRFGEADGLGSDAFAAVHARGDTVWAGTSRDGLSASFDAGASWQTARASFPTAALGAPARADTIQTYAFPNPFSPINHGVVRIRYSLSAPADVTVEVFDIASQRVATLLDRQPQTAGEQFVPWDGKNGRHTRVANGVYFYRIQTRDGLHAFGKIVVLD